MSVRLDDELARRFSRFASVQGLSESDALRALLSLALEQSGSPVAKAALMLQARFVSDISKATADLTRRVTGELRRLVPDAA